MRRREFILRVGGAAACLPHLAAAQHLALLLIGSMLVSLAQPASAQRVTKIEYVSFDTNVVPSSTAVMPVRLRAKLYTPADATFAISAVVITPSSGGVREEVEVYYARELVRAGIAVLVIDSFGSRGTVTLGP